LENLRRPAGRPSTFHGTKPVYRERHYPDLRTKIGNAFYRREEQLLTNRHKRARTVFVLAQDVHKNPARRIRDSNGNGAFRNSRRRFSKRF
jgi:hypothetical protein